MCRARRRIRNNTPYVRAKTSENRKNTEFRTILEMGLREAYPGRVVADAAAGATRRWVGVMEGPKGASLAVGR